MGLYSYRRRLEACTLGFKKERDCNICIIVKTKALISFAVYCEADLCLCFGIGKTHVFS